MLDEARETGLDIFGGFEGMWVLGAKICRLIYLFLYTVANAGLLYEWFSSLIAYFARILSRCLFCSYAHSDMILTVFGMAG